MSRGDDAKTGIAAIDYSITPFLVNWRSGVGYRDVRLPQGRGWREELVAVLKEMARATGG